MIKIDKINKSYGEKEILKDINCDLEQGKIYALVGSNGTGKTTLMNVIAGGITAEQGAIYINNMNHSLHESKKHLFFVPDDKEMFLTLTGREYISFILTIYGVNLKKAQLQVDELINAFKMEDDINELIASYSLGMKQKIYVIAALTSGAGNIMLDEPFNCLDPLMSCVLKEQLKKAVEDGKTVLYSTHNLDTVARFCDSVLILGRTHELYLVSSLQDVEALEKMFFEKCV